MKNNLLLAFSLLAFLVGRSQNPVLNQGFETWESSTQPQDWHYSSGITQSTQSHSGTYAAKGSPWVDGNSVSSPDLSAGNGDGDPVSQKYNYVNFYYIFSPDSGDKLQVVVYVDDGGGNTFGQVTHNITNPASNYTFASVPITYNYNSTPSDVTIDFFIVNSSGDPHLSSYFIIDDVSLTTSPVSGVDPIQAPLDFSVSPNPACTFININTGNKFYENSVIQIYDIVGRVVKTEQLSAQVQQININNLSGGLYTVALKQGSQQITKKLQIVR